MWRGHHANKNLALYVNSRAGYWAQRFSFIDAENQSKVCNVFTIRLFSEATYKVKIILVIACFLDMLERTCNAGLPPLYPYGQNFEFIQTSLIGSLAVDGHYHMIGVLACSLDPQELTPHPSIFKPLLQGSLLFKHSKPFEHKFHLLT